MARGVVGRGAKVAVIGAGPSGLAGAKALLDEGFSDVTVLDRGSEVGGNWVFDADSGHSSVFETTHIISSKRYSQYDDFPMADSWPDYPSHRLLARYFRDYATHFGLYPRIRFGTTVTRCVPDEASGEGWRVTSEGPDGEVTDAERFDVLVVANGHHWKPRWPSYPGAYSGELLHSHGFKRAAPFAGRRVLVIGGGNSACDVAVETSRVAASTDISWRRGYWIVPKFLLGQPSDVLHNTIAEKLAFLPAKARLRAQETLLRLLVGSHASYGLPEPDHHLGETHPTLNSELLYFLRHGAITARPDIARWDGLTVTFKDGATADYDAVVACTGFEIAHPFFAPTLIDYSSGPPPLYLKMIPERFDDLYFLGLFQPLGCIWPSAALQAKIMARRMTGAWRTPDDLGGAIADELANPDVAQLDTPRHTITVDAPKFRARLLAELPEDHVRRMRSPHATAIAGGTA